MIIKPKLVYKYIKPQNQALIEVDFNRTLEAQVGGRFLIAIDGNIAEKNLTTIGRIVLGLGERVCCVYHYQVHHE